MSKSNITIHGSFQPPLKEEDVARVEKQLGISLPDDYKEFLLVHNGGYPEPNAFPISGYPLDDGRILNQFFGIRKKENYDLLGKARVFRDRVPPNLLPIADDPFGNLICLSVSGPDRGKVYYWFHEEEAEEGQAPTYDNVYFIANSFSDLLNSLTELPEEDEDDTE